MVLLALAAMPPDVRKGFAFPATKKLEVRLCLTSEAQPRKNGGAVTESHRLSAHQAAQPRRNPVMPFRVV
jgi:hypothetical protein